MPIEICNFNSSKIAIYTKDEAISYKKLYALVKQAKKDPVIKAELNIETICAILSALLDERPLFLQNPHLPHFSIPTLLEKGLYLATSGSTGSSKIALLSKKNLLYNAIGANAFLGLSCDDIWQLNLPLFHVGGIGVLLRSFLVGASLALPLAKALPTLTSLVPTQLYRAIKHQNLLPSVKKYIIGGSPLSSQLKEKAKEAGLNLYLTYGLTEMASMVTLGINHLGQPLQYRKIIFAEDQEILLSGQTLFEGYLEPNGTVTKSHSPFKSGDIGTLDPLGNLILQGRKSRMFIKGGENIHPEEIEKALLELEEIEEASVIAIANEEYGEIPVAFVKINDRTPKKEEEIFDTLKYKIGSFKIPHHILPMPEYTTLKPSLLKLKEIALQAC